MIADQLLKYQVHHLGGNAPVYELPNQVKIEEVLVTICVFTYNHESHISRCLDSLLQQKTDFKFAIYIGEDQSPDATREICKKYAKENPEKIRLFLHDRRNNISINNKPSGRFNSIFAYHVINSRYLAICEGDDYWTDQRKLQKQIDFLRNNPDYGICYTHCLIRENGVTRKYDKTISGIFSFIDSVQEKHGATLTMVFDKSVFDAKLFAETTRKSTMGDWPIECLITMYRKGKVLEETTAVYQRLGSGITSTHLTNPLNYYHSRINFLEALLRSGRLEDKGQSGIVVAILRKCYFMRAWLYLAEGNVRFFSSDIVRYLKYCFSRQSLAEVRFIDRFRFSNMLKASIAQLVASKRS